MRWTKEQIETCKQMTREGFTASRIGAAIGVSRNAVIGKWFRTGYFGSSARPKVKKVSVRKPGGTTPYHYGKTVPSHDRLRNPPRPAPSIEPTCVLMQLTNTTCRWPINDGNPRWLFCGCPDADLAAGEPYCANHMRMGLAR
jgi:GcrA cell cycle regulator